MKGACHSLLLSGAILLAFSAALCGQSQSAAPSADKPRSAEPAETAVSPDAERAHNRDFMIGKQDILAVSVWKEPEISRVLPVRSDGKISLPLVGEVQAAGRTPVQLEQEIASKLRSYITDPQVTVMVQQINSEKYNILGEVSRPGSYPLAMSETILDAIAEAGGFRDFAKLKGVYVLRRGTNGEQLKLPFNYKEVIRGLRPEQNIHLQPNDTIVVP